MSNVISKFSFKYKNRVLKKKSETIIFCRFSFLSTSVAGCKFFFSYSHSAFWHLISASATAC